jgi:protein required for attachment to host cells
MTNIAVHTGAWVLVADGRRALFLYNHGDPDLIDLRVIEARVHEIPPTRELGSDAPGRAFPGAASPPGQGMPGAGSAGGRSSVENSDWHELEKEHFAHEIADKINRAAESNEMKEIVIMAPPRVLGELRKELSAKAQSRVRGELDKDFTRHPLPEIEKALARQFTQTS